MVEELLSFSLDMSLTGDISLGSCEVAKLQESVHARTRIAIILYWNIEPTNCHKTFHTVSFFITEKWILNSFQLLAHLYHETKLQHLQRLCIVPFSRRRSFIKYRKPSSHSQSRKRNYSFDALWTIGFTSYWEFTIMYSGEEMVHI